MNKKNTNASKDKSKDVTDTSKEADVDSNKRIGPVFKFGIATGFALIFLGGGSLSLSLTSTILEILIVCAGLGIILGAFGSTASISIPTQGITLAGVAAIVVGLFVILMSQLDDRYMRVKVGGDIEEATVELVGDDNYFGAYRDRLRTYDFIIFGNELEREALDLYIVMKDQREYIFRCIDANKIRPHLASGKTVEWAFILPKDENTTPKIITANGKPVADDVGNCRPWVVPADDETSTGSSSLFGSLPGIISAAFAQSGSSISNNDINTLMRQLESNTSRVRRNARSNLANGGVAIVKPLLTRLSRGRVSYRLKLGIIVSLTEMLRLNRGKRRNIMNEINLNDLERLRAATADKDRTTRIYASEFLHDLGDPRMKQLEAKG